MPARNIYHNAVAHALIADGWTITDDPLTLSYGGRDLLRLRLIVFDAQQERIVRWIR